jgi:hypothetical protein
VQAAHDATPVGGCLEIDGDYTLTSNFNVTKDIDILCPVARHGLRTGAGISQMLISASGVTVDGCDLTGNGATTSTAVYLLGSIANVKLDNLLVRSIQTGVVGDSGVQHDITVEDSTFENIGGTGTAWYHGQESDNVRILQNTYRRTQRSGVAGQAGIQSGGSPELRHHHWMIQGTTVENLTCAANPSGRVDIGLDQIADSVIDHNVVRHGNDYGEGIVDNELRGFMPGGGPCSILSPFVYTSVNNNPDCWLAAGCVPRPLAPSDLTSAKETSTRCAAGACPGTAGRPPPQGGDGHTPAWKGG